IRGGRDIRSVALGGWRLGGDRPRAGGGDGRAGGAGGGVGFAPVLLEGEDAGADGARPLAGHPALLGGVAAGGGGGGGGAGGGGGGRRWWWWGTRGGRTYCQRR